MIRINNSESAHIYLQNLEKDLQSCQNKMTNHRRLEDRLEGATHFSSWKTHVMIILREMELEDYVESIKIMPDNDLEKTTWKRHINKTMKMIIDSMKDHILPSISNLNIAFEMFSKIKDTSEINNTSRLLTLK